MSGRLQLIVACLLISVCGVKLNADGVDFSALESIVENGTKTCQGPSYSPSRVMVIPPGVLVSLQTPQRLAVKQSSLSSAF